MEKAEAGSVVIQKHVATWMKIRASLLLNNNWSMRYILIERCVWYHKVTLISPLIWTQHQFGQNSSKITTKTCKGSISSINNLSFLPVSFNMVLSVSVILIGNLYKCSSWNFMSFFIEIQLVFNRKRSLRSARPKCYFPKLSYKKRDDQKMQYF